MALLFVHSAHGVYRVVLSTACQTQAYSAAPHWPTVLSSTRQDEGHDILIIDFHSTGSITLRTDDMMEVQVNHHVVINFNKL